VTSAARREANRANALASTGPRTTAGKAISARNTRRHGLSLPALRDPALADEIAALARAIAGPQASPRRFALACRIAAAQIDLIRVRRARHDAFSDVLHDPAAPARLAVFDRYEQRARSRRKFAIRQFDAAGSEVHSADFGQTNPTSTEGCFGQTNPTSEAAVTHLAERTQRSTDPDFGQTNPKPDLAHFGQTKPTSSEVLRRVSTHRGKVCGKINVRLHRTEMIRAARRRPNLVRDRLCPQPRPLFEAGIGPNVHESRHRAGDRMHGSEQRRYCCAARRPLAPQLDGRRHSVRLEDIGAYLEYGAVLPGRHGRHEWERDVRVHARGRDVFTDPERVPAPQYLLPLRMDARDVGSCADQQDAVEGADIGTPTGQEPIAGRERLLQARKRLLLRTGPHGDDRYVIVHSGFSCVLTPTIRN